jgi:hypothetical protein
MSAAWELIHLAALELAASSPIKQRLVSAYSKFLWDMDSTELPRGTRGEFDSLRKELTRVAPFRGESAVAATVRKMSNDEAASCARRIVQLLNLARDEGAAAPARSQRAVVSLFSAEA